MNRNKSYKGAFTVSLIFNVVLLAMLTVIGINSTKQAEIVSGTDVPELPAAVIVSQTDTETAGTEVMEVDVPSEEDALGDGEDLVEVTTTTPAPVVTTAENTTTAATTSKKTAAGTTKATSAKTTAAPAPTTKKTTTTTQKPTTTTTKGSGDNDAGFEDIFISPTNP